jgi:hypothetical protein
MSSKKKCFVVTPIGSDDDPIRRHIDGIIKAAIRPTLKDNYEVLVAHEMPNIGSITKQIINEIFISDLVIANLTNTNPNVMYELAFRHCVGKPTIQIAEKGTRIPFDIGTERTILYINDSQGVLDLKAEIEKFVSEIDFTKDHQGPIYDVLRSINYENLLINESEINANSSPKDKDILRYLVDKIDMLDQKITINRRLSENIDEYDVKKSIYELHNRLIHSKSFSKNFLYNALNRFKRYEKEINSGFVSVSDKEQLQALIDQSYKIIESYLNEYDTLTINEKIIAANN